MNTISIHVPPALAHNFEKAGKEKREKAELYISAWLSAFLSGKSPDDRLIDIMHQASELAKKNGLTPAILDSLLKDEK